MRGQIAHGAIGLALGAPATDLGVCKEIFRHLAAKPSNLSNASLGHHFTDLLAGGRADVIETHHVNHAGRRGGVNHGPALLQRDP